MSLCTLNRAALVAALLLALAACSKNNGAEDAGLADATVAAPVDGGTADAGPAGPPPVECLYDDDCGPSERCREPSADQPAKCVPAATCDVPENCVPSDDEDAPRLYCENEVGLGCRCVKPSGATSGYCKRRLPACAPCTNDEQCGSDSSFKTPFHEPAKCMELAGAKVCLETFVPSKCACGQSVNLGGAFFCAPQGAPPSCIDGAFLCCASNGNCPPEHPVCNTQKGRCEDVCWYDYEKDQTIGCRADQVCNVDPAFLTPTSKNYGAGRCGPACASDLDCQMIRGDFVCKAESKSDKRCRPAGCIADLECPNPDESLPYLGYCERSTGICVCKDKPCNCRVGVDAITNSSFNDCRPGFKCEEPTPGAGGQCLEKNCYEQGGAQDFCGWNQLCCGEDRDQDPNTPVEGCTDPNGASVALKGKCYDAPKPPWCVSCDSHAKCAAPGYPGTAKDVNLCMSFGPDAKGTDRGDSCVYACTRHSECPKGFLCKDIEVNCSADPGVCGNPANCTDTGFKDGDGNPIKWCKCSTPGTKGGDCPKVDPNDPNSLVTRCGDNPLGGSADAGTGWYHCIYTHGCIPTLTACMPAAAPKP